jgi:hypothetical protein
VEGIFVEVILHNVVRKFDGRAWAQILVNRGVIRWPLKSHWAASRYGYFEIQRQNVFDHRAVAWLSSSGNVIIGKCDLILRLAL